MSNNTMTRLGFLLLAVAVFSAPIEEPTSFASEYDAVVPEVDESFVVPESPSDDLLEISAKDADSTKHAKRAALGRKNRSCKYEIIINSHAKDKGKKEDKDLKQKKELSSRYTLSVTPTSKVNGALEFKIQGVEFKQFNGKEGHHEGKPHDASKSFKRCHVHVAQKKSGSVLAGTVVMKKGSKCLKWEQNIILGSISTLTPHFHHEHKAHKFELVEDTDIFGKEGQVRMAYHSQRLSNGDTAVHAKGEDIMEELQTVSGMKKTMIQSSVKAKHHIDRHGIVKKSKTSKKVEVGNIDGHSEKPMPISKDRLGATPKGATDKKDRPTINKQETKVSLHVKLLGCSHSGATVVEDISVEELIAKNLAAGGTQLSHMEHEHELDHVAAMAPERLSKTVTKMTKKMVTMSANQANALAMNMMELKPIREEALRQIHQGVLTGNDEAHELLNALGALVVQPKMSTANHHEIVTSLIDAAMDDSLPDNTREQAMYSLENDQCHDFTPSIQGLDAVLAHARDQDEELDEVGEFALQMQHGLMADQVTCEPANKAAILKENTERLARTEALLQTAMQAGKYQYARVMMTSLANSRFERHAAPIEQVLHMNDVPDHVRYGALIALGKLDGTSQRKAIGMYVHDDDTWVQRAAREAWAGDYLEDEDDPRKTLWSAQPHPTEEEALLQLEKKAGKDKKKKFCTVGPFNWAKDWPLPATGDFQVIGGLNTGVDASGAKAIATGTVKVYSWQKKIVSMTAEKQGIGLCGESKPASITLKLLKKTVWKYKKKGGKKKKTKKKKVGKKVKVQQEFNNPLDEGGLCMTKMSSGGKKNCLMGQKVWKKTFFNIQKRFQLGPVPCNAGIKLTGKWGIDYGFGFLGDCTGAAAKKPRNKKKKKEEEFKEAMGLVQKKAGKKKSKKCAPPDMTDTGFAFNGFMIMMNPFAAADLTVLAEINALVVKVGVAAEVQLLNIGLPVTLESCVHGDCKNQCINGQLSTKAGGGRVYVYLKTFWSAQDEWDVFDWAGGSWVWPEPKPDVYTGVCIGPDIKTTPPPPPPALTTTDCIVDIYANDNYGGAMLKRCNTNNPLGSWCRVVNGGKTENNANSYKMYGKCNKMEIIDEDGCKPGYSDNLMRDKSEPSVPWDIRDDTCGVKIWAAGDVEVFGDGEFNGWAAGLQSGDYDRKSLKEAGVKNNAISSLKVHYGCEATMYNPDNFKGGGTTFGPGDYNHAAFTAAGAKNDAVTSIKVKCNSEAFVGCFKDKSSRAMSVSKGKKDAPACAKACSSYTYFALQANDECMCGDGDDYKKYGSSDKCTCHSKFKGDWQNCVYETHY